MIRGGGVWVCVGREEEEVEVFARAGWVGSHCEHGMMAPFTVSSDL